jgi:hypothetical protein
VNDLDLYLQLERVLSSEKRQSYDHVFIDVIALTVKEMLQNDQTRTEEYFLDLILNPLRHIDCYSEEEINKAVLQVYSLCVMPSNDTIAVPIQITLPVFSILFFVFTHIKVRLRNTGVTLLGILEFSLID